MLLAVGGKSRAIVLGEVLPVTLNGKQDSAQESAQEVVVQCVQDNSKDKWTKSKEQKFGNLKLHEIKVDHYKTKFCSKNGNCLIVAF
ncbi:hypothetical protein TSAR_001799 [Trichomalopsis sarcophagae]|uniref:Uncharacterized protein n=1 Tax=Trichomalopsis sarcophagae TaxID=543379 RepID=A0A232EMJ2_9HYME|nr:hypothetical protein TSAR_001799 [Trichomalopsis sarcophagae]